MKMTKGSEILGIVLGITLVSPSLLVEYQSIAHYSSEVIPAILAGVSLVYLERLFRKISTESLSMLIVPFCSLISSIALTQMVWTYWTYLRRCFISRFSVLIYNSNILYYCNYFWWWIYVFSNERNAPHYDITRFTNDL